MVGGRITKKKNVILVKKKSLLVIVLLIAIAIYEFNENKLGIFDKIFSNFEVPFAKEYLNCKLIGEAISEGLMPYGIRKNEKVFYIDKQKKIIRPSSLNEKVELIKKTYDKGFIRTKFIHFIEGVKVEGFYEYNRFNKELIWNIKDDFDVNNDGFKERKFVFNCKKN